jgi:cytoskeletal protein CcmA (bactofilin family)
MIWKHDDTAAGQPEQGGKRMAEQSGGEVTIVGQGAKLEGDIVSAGSLRVDGHVKGRIDAEGDVILSAQSTVEADIRAASITVAGRLKGDIVAKAKAELARGGRVDGNITAKTLIIQEGGIFNGQSVMDAAPSGAQSALRPAEGQPGAAKA